LMRDFCSGELEQLLVVLYSRIPVAKLLSLNSKIEVKNKMVPWE